MDPQVDANSKVSIKLAKVYRTVCQMARDRGYPDTDSLMRDNKVKIESDNQAEPRLIFPPLSHKLNDDETFAQKLQIYQILQAFHCQTKLTIEELKRYDSVISKQQEAFLNDNPQAIVFASIIILVQGDSEDKDVVPKKIQDVVLISNKIFRDELEVYEKRWVNLKFPSAKQVAQKTRKEGEPRIYLKYEMFNIDDLVVNITEHQLVPKHIPLDCVEKRILMDKYKINESQLPKMLATDPISKYFGLRSKQVFKIERNSETAGKYITYRVVN